MSKQYLIVHCFYNIDQIYFISIFHVFILDNFFEHANKLIHVQIHLTL